MHEFSDTTDYTPGVTNGCEAPPPTGACGETATLIHGVQGPGFTSPLVGQTVIVEAVVVGDFQDSDELNGFFVQEEDADFDDNAATSEGVFVDESSYAGPDVNEGDRVRVVGTVVENLTHTEIAAAGVLYCDNAEGLYNPVDVTLPEETNGDLEKVEGMYVNVTNSMSVAQNYFVGRYGQLTLSSDLTNRLFQPTNQVLPNTPESAALADYNARSLLFLDDGMDVSACGDNPNPVPYLGWPPPAVLRGGDQVSGLIGVLDYGQINTEACYDSSTLVGRDYRLHPTQDPVFTTQNSRAIAPDDVGGSLKVVSFNVLNFFNGDGQGSGFPTSRGAYNFLEFVRQRIKIYEALKAIDGDIVGVMEIENDGFDQYSAIAELVKVMNDGPCWNSPNECVTIGYSNAGLGAGTYAYIDASPGVVGTDEITVGFIYKPATVTPVGSPWVINDPAFTDPNNYGEQKNRPAIAQIFSYANGDLFTAIVNHLKSKGSECGAPDDDPEQGSCNDTRTKAAQYLVDTVVPAVQVSSGDPDVMIIGDLNAYAMEDPIRALTDGGFTNLVKSFNGDYAYTYTFDGMVGYLDHSLSNSSLTPQITGVTEWHINTDEPAVIDYENYYNPPGYYNPNAFRASDHDPVIVGICETISPVFDELSVTPDTLWPPNHKYVDVTATVVVSDNFDPNLTVELVSVTSNEPDDGLGDGDTANDIVIVDDFHFQLRAERSGAGEGRIYTITYEVTDACGNSTIATVTVVVPHNK
jgi:predicted extracellular nuclease